MVSDAKKITELERNAYNTLVRGVHLDSKFRKTSFYEPAEHRTFEWYILTLSKGLDEIYGFDKADLASFRANRNTLAMVDGITRALHTLFHEDGLAPHPDVVRWTMPYMGKTKEQAERLAYHLSQRLKDFLEQVRQAEDEHATYRVVPNSKRRSPRERMDLPDPSAPAWSTLNRQPSERVQVACRISEEVKDYLTQDAAARRISQSEWLNEAIISELVKQGYDVSVERNFRPPPMRGLTKRRPQRSASERPDPDKRADAAVNRPYEITNIRIDPILAQRIADDLDPDENRMMWFGKAVQNFLYSREELPGPRVEQPNYTIAVALHFDRSVYILLNQSAKESGVSRSEWLRRVAHWYLTSSTRL